MYSIVIPFPSNSKTIQKCLNYIHDNSMYEHEIKLLVDEKDVYHAFNKGVFSAKYDTVVLMNDDMIVSKDWDKFILGCPPNIILTGYVVEANPGKMNSGPQCIQYDCGDIDTFDYDKFQKFVDEHSQTVEDVKPNSVGWYMPLVVHQSTFVSYPNIDKFPWYANDTTLITQILPFVGFKFGQMKSYVYHFSRASTKLNFTQSELDNVPPRNI